MSASAWDWARADEAERVERRAAEATRRRAFDPTLSRFARRMAIGHLARTGHDLTGFYEVDAEGVAHLVRTCACGGDA